ncbi:hypothetical protein UA38_00505 [Photobacterium kishitanii]|uniref:DUF481 domain-containing protein n=1 Tax=Photobacterium kishitanii TaxID=318456 RepID=A0AAX0Z198_9GAMM|nr:DUF481 domain-containing protein [Photobacterium kishitanii]KJG59691.1 hypothetical protein UA38_00505 [Photobacterium kishitanii]KJG62981.1 hypothetical protein UA42_00860 [Photobacterium kishitanii]KJG68008.1 hypothetical protein UA40_01975 [Photobacterium kishitanii]KJG71157.1 hypothetical protein UA41_00515 [Photobacterium kishitanii]PSX20550.1 DUF481 domain-containing protein [Photobacterium kishitanii]
MKPVITVVSAAVGLLLSSVTNAEEITMFDYEEATSAYQDAYLNAQFDLQSGNQDQTSFSTDASANYDQVFSSADRNTRINFVGDTSMSRGSNSDDTTKKNYQALASLTNDMYFNPTRNNAFWYSKAEIGAQTDMVDPFTKLTVGLGYGRVVNATPMAKTIRVVQELQERGLLTGSVSRSTYQDVANIIAREPEYRSHYGSADYAEYWVEDIGKALGVTLGARGAIKSYDVLVNERISTRKYGWLVRAGVGAVLTNYDGSDTKPALELGAEYHYPISNQLQFSNEAILTAVLDDGDNGFNASNAMSLTYELRDNIDWENTWLLNYSESDGSEDLMTNSLKSAFRYYVSNVISLTLTAGLSKTEDHIDYDGTPQTDRNDDIDKTVQLGLTYRLK